MAITQVTRYRTDDGEIHQTNTAAEAHELKLAQKAWQVGVSHYLTRLLQPGPLTDAVGARSPSTVINVVAAALCQNADEVRKLLSERPS